MTPAEVTRDLLSRVRGGGSTAAILVLAALAVIGGVALIILLAGGPEPRSKWGYAAATLGFLLSTGGAAPIVAFGTRLAKGYWAIPIRRAAEIHALSGLITAPLFIALLFQLPDWRDRWSVWATPNVLGHWPGAPLLWDSIFILLLVFTGLALLYLSNIPDFAAARDAGAGGLAARWSVGWRGTQRQWTALTAGLVIVGAFYLMVFVFVHMFVVVDLAMSLVPGWKSSILAPYHAVSGLQGGVATTILTAALLRKVGGLDRYIPMDAFWGAAKPLLGLSLLFFYFTWSEFLPSWYGRMPEEQSILLLLVAGPYLPLFVLGFSCCFILPLLLLMWNAIRVSINGPTWVAGIVLAGNLIDRIRIYVASWSVAGPVGQHMDLAHVPAAPQLPGALDLAILVGGIAAALLTYLVALRFVPPISIWEYKTALLLKIERPYFKTEVAVIAKPQ